MLRLAIAGSVSVLLALSVQAQTPGESPEALLRAPDMVISSVTLDDLRLLTDEVGAQVLEQGQSSRGSPYLVVQMPSGLMLGAYTVCGGGEDAKCRGVEFAAVLQRPVSDEVVAELDRSFVAVSVQRGDAESVHVSRYVILDHGVTWANLTENLKVFELLCHHVMSRLAPTVIAGSADDRVDP